VSERELRDGVFFADVGEEEVRRAVERVIHESVFDAGVVVFGFTDCYESGTSDCFSRGVCVEFSQSKEGIDKRLFGVCRVCSIRK
jgi:hypothetical protein|tara:strand:+ start:249 stop:503 length:255 start_codon:yes stop_codon:yes gene_type:complete